jgi:hypothetical protein
MARKASKATATRKRAVTTSKASERVKGKSTSEIRTQYKTAAKVKPVRKRREEARVKGVTEKVAGSFQALVDAIQETDVVRRK